MSSTGSATVEGRLLRDLVSSLSHSGRETTLSVGIVGSAKHRSQPPAQCLHTCLGGDPEALESRGCTFLAGAARGEIDLSAVRDGYCPQGHHVAAQRTAVWGEDAVLLTVEGRLPPVAPDSGDAQLLGPLDAASRLVQRVGQLLEENTGFAEEILQSYEQLNLIFDLTQQIAEVTDVNAIERLLLERMARLLGAHAACVVTPDDECRAYGAGGGTACGTAPELPVDPLAATEALECVRRQRQVHVSSVDGWQLIAGPLVRLDDKVDVAIAVSPASRGTFKSGDMMLVESVLAFGGQIISNSELHERLRKMSIEVTRALVAAIDKKDHYTSGHSERVGFLTGLTARGFGLREAERQVMEWAGLLHDVGKIGIPEEILCKPGKLTEEEFEVIKGHPTMGYEILKPIASLELVLDGVFYHHEHPDGSGYPKGLRADEIPLVARIIHVADTFDALTSTRSYRKAFSMEKAINIIREEAGKRIDAEVADRFLQAFEAYRREDPEDYAERFAAVRELEVVDAWC